MANLFLVLIFLILSQPGVSSEEEEKGSNKSLGCRNTSVYYNPILSQTGACSLIKFPSEARKVLHSINKGFTTLTEEQKNNLLAIKGILLTPKSTPESVYKIATPRVLYRGDQEWHKIAEAKYNQLYRLSCHINDNAVFLDPMSLVVYQFINTIEQKIISI